MAHYCRTSMSMPPPEAGIDQFCCLLSLRDLLNLVALCDAARKHGLHDEALPLYTMALDALEDAGLFASSERLAAYRERQRQQREINEYEY